MKIKERYINPFTDFGFKRLFGTEFNKELLIDFLNQVLGDREQIKDLTYLNTEQQGRSETNRKAVYDLYCENEKGEKFIIEVAECQSPLLQGPQHLLRHLPLARTSRERRAVGLPVESRLYSVYPQLLFSRPQRAGTVPAGSAVARQAHL
jgi:hypothetical protein